MEVNCKLTSSIKSIKTKYLIGSTDLKLNSNYKTVLH